MIPVADLVRQHRTLAPELGAAFSRVMKRGSFILGAEVAVFEQEFSRYLGVHHAIGVASGTDALTLALLAIGLRPGDEVIVPANAYPTIFGVIASGARPRLVDIDPTTYTIDPAALTAAVSKKTKAIVPVHLYGQPANMEKILQIARWEKIAVVEDCAQAAGATLSVASPALSAGAQVLVSGSLSHKLPRLLKSPREKTIWKKAGSLSDLGCFSFYPTKNLGCLGDGGMVVTDDPDLAARVRRLRMYGEVSRYTSVELGRNSRLDELQAAFLRIKLKYLDGWNERRREIANLYKSKVKSQKSKVQIKSQNENSQLTTHNSQLPAEAPYAHHVYHLYVIRSKQRDRLKSYLEKQGVGTAIHYPVPIHLVPSMKYLGYKKGDFPESERACNEVLSLPMYPELTDNEVQQIAQAVKNFDQ